MAIEDDDKPRKKITHEIGQDLSLLSVEELTERIALLNSEIARLQEAVTKKRASKDAANSFALHPDSPPVDDPHIPIPECLSLFEIRLDYTRIGRDLLERPFGDLDAVVECDDAV